MKTIMKKMTAIFAVITTLIFSMGIMPVFAAEDAVTTEWPVSSEEMLNAYYDFNEDGQIDIPDLVIAKRMSLVGDKLSFSDYELVKEKILTGEWKYELEYMEVDLDDLVYSEEVAAMIDMYKYGYLVDMQIDGDAARIRYLNDVTVWELRLSRKASSDLVRPIVYTFDKGDMHILFELTEENNLAWTECAEGFAPNFPNHVGQVSLWPTSAEEMSRYYDFDGDNALTVFDMCIARKELGRLSTDDLENLSQYLLTGEWSQAIDYEEVDLDDLSYCSDTLAIINYMTAGMLVDEDHAEETLRLRFLNGVKIKEIRVERYDEVIFNIMDFNYNGESFCIGFTANNELAWNWHSEDKIPEMEDCEDC